MHCTTPNIQNNETLQRRDSERKQANKPRRGAVVSQRSSVISRELLLSVVAGVAPMLVLLVAVPEIGATSVLLTEAVALALYSGV
jgi:hypothetical protein